MGKQNDQWSILKLEGRVIVKLKPGRGKETYIE